MAKVELNRLRTQSHTTGRLPSLTRSDLDRAPQSLAQWGQAVNCNAWAWGLAVALISDLYRSEIKWPRREVTHRL